ncbi:nicotinate-nucleotide adenylyltransferase [bacterium]|nr:nicotinate-nucleotide adenylyltransferase [candidate division CSSED10-310 bacterium]
MRRLGIIGGTFDPVHTGHLIAAEEARDVLGLDHMMFIPARIPPHKQAWCISDAKHRLAMLHQAVDANPMFSVNPMELERTGPSFTVDTIRAIRTGYTVEDILFIMGHDSFHEIETWFQYQQLISLCRLVVVSRPGTPPVQPEHFSESIRRLFPHQVISLDSSSKRMDNVMTSPWRICFLIIAGLKVSASEIRFRVRTGRSIRYVVPDGVRQYIIDNHLYSEDSGGIEGNAYSAHK